jgi:hypothetical protein
LSGETTAQASTTVFKRVETGISTKLLALRLPLVLAENGDEPERKVACTKKGLKGIREYRNILQRLRLVRRADRCIPEPIAILSRRETTTDALLKLCVCVMIMNHRRLVADVKKYEGKPRIFEK